MRFVKTVTIAKLQISPSQSRSAGPGGRLLIIMLCCFTWLGVINSLNILILPAVIVSLANWKVPLGLWGLWGWEALPLEDLLWYSYLWRFMGPFRGTSTPLGQTRVSIDERSVNRPMAHGPWPRVRRSSYLPDTALAPPFAPPTFPGQTNRSE